MYRQSVSDLRLAVLELDGCLFNLNHYRYNYYHNLCRKHRVTLTKEEFHQSLGDMYTMYDQLPLIHRINSLSLNQKCEKDLLKYMSLKGIKPRDGVKELIEYLRQKKIKIAVVSSHKTRNAIEYLKMGDLYHKVDYVVGGDTKLNTLPSGEVFTYLKDKFEVTSSQIILVTSMTSLLMAANKLEMNTIFFEDLVPAGNIEKKRSYETTNSMYEVLNDIIFGQYDDYSIYETVLGMDDENLSPVDLSNIRNHLLDVYSDDDNILKIINKTYENRMQSYDAPTRFVFEDEIDPATTHPKNLKTPTKKEVNKVLSERFANDPEAGALFGDLLEDEDEEMPTLSMEEALSKLVPEESKEEEPKEEEDVLERLKQEEIEDMPVEEETPSKWGILMEILYILILAGLIVVVGLIIYVLLLNRFENGAFSFIITLYNTYQGIADGVMELVINIFNKIHLAPLYVDYVNSNALMSPEGVHIFNVYILNVLILIVITLIKSMIPKKETRTI